MKKIILALIFTTSLAIAGHDTGGGGIGLQIGNKVYLYDFVEAGIEEDVYINSNVTDEMKASQAVSLQLRTNAEVIEGVVKKINEIYRISPSFAFRLLTTLKSYQWRFVKPTLIQTRDIGRSPIQISADQKQIAYRDDKQMTVTIDKEILARMPINHQVGLYFHEILYSMSNDFDSYRTRIITSYLFHPQFQDTNFEELSLRVKLFNESIGELIDYRTYSTLLSPEFKTACDKFKRENAQFFADSYNYIRSLYMDLRNAYYKDPTISSMRLYSKKDLSQLIDRKTLEKYFQINDVSFMDNANYMAFANSKEKTQKFYLPLNVYQWNLRDDYNPKVEDKVYTMNTRLLRPLESYKSKSSDLLNKNRNLFEGVSCLDSQDIAFLTKLANTFPLDT